MVGFIRQQCQLTGELSKSLDRNLLDKAKEAKEALSHESVFTVEFEDDSGTHHSVMISINKFEQLIAPLIKNTLRACRRALKDAKLEKQQVIEVVMVGGSTRVPLVCQQVGDFSSVPH